MSEKKMAFLQIVKYIFQCAYQFTRQQNVMLKTNST